MNYKIVLDSGEPRIKPIPLVLMYREPWQRPSVGGLIEYKKTEYRIVSCSPSDNPDNRSVTYTVRLNNPQAPYRKGQIVRRRGYTSGIENQPAIN